MCSRYMCNTHIPHSNTPKHTTHVTYVAQLTMAAAK